jgi:hypothetical protein
VHTDILSSILWAVSFILTAIGLRIAIRLIHAWPSLVALFSLDLVISASLFFLRSNYAWYFYVFWVGSALQSACRLWVLADALRSIPGASFIPARVRQVIFSAALVMAVCAGLRAWTGKVHWVHHSPWLSAALLYNRASAFACLSLCVGILAAIFLLGLGWDLTGARIVCGLGIELAIAAVSSALFAESSHKLRAAADYSNNSMHVLVLSLWIFALMRPGPSHRKQSFQ